MNSLRNILGGMAAVALAVASPVVQAEEEVPEQVVSKDRASALAATCAACHGTEGRLNTEIPAIAGKPEQVLSIMLVAFRNDQMPNATVMPRLTKGFTEEELQAIARYFSELEVQEDE